jgi:hypothetical protein
LLPIALPDYYSIAAPFPGHWTDYLFAKSSFQSALFWFGQRKIEKLIKVKRTGYNFLT